MSIRLEKIASLVNEGVGVADVGTDHGYIPVMLRRRGYKGNIVATDINDGPLNKAKISLAEAGFSDSVNLVLCDGLQGCEPDCVDTIIVAGMGGDTITGIIDRAEWTYKPGIKLILQPVTKPEILRYWLVNNDYLITDEYLVKENGTVYQIFCAEIAKPVKYSDAELYVGKFEKIRNSEYFAEHIHNHIKRFKSAVDGLKRAERSGLDAWLEINDIVLNELTEMRRCYDDDCK
ncbi:MAG: class I SAM-dependent methyltransferase [Bacillota bacterium]|nr:class I SAM-dependent methyltransferase [Bacillota bacterium]